VRLNTIHEGDCDELFLGVPTGSVDLVFADPPFNIGYQYDVYEDARTVEDYLSWTERWMGQARRVLKPEGTLWVAIGDEFAAEVKVIGHRTLGLTPRNWVIWHYTFGVHCTRKFTRSHAHLHYFTRHPKRFTFNDEAIRVPSARQVRYNDRRADPRGRVPDDTWSYSRVCGTFKERAGFHGCQMPEQLLGRVIRACTNPGDVVLDPFAGSGTTPAVAKKLGRQYLGFELSADYARLARERIDRAEAGQPLAGTTVSWTEGMP
jgi:site-specific DNA-methyltransferase (adenine-specific)